MNEPLEKLYKSVIDAAEGSNTHAKNIVVHLALNVRDRTMDEIQSIKQEIDARIELIKQLEQTLDELSTFVTKNKGRVSLNDENKSNKFNS